MPRPGDGHSHSRRGGVVQRDRRICDRDKRSMRLLTGLIGDELVELHLK